MRYFGIQSDAPLKWSLSDPVGKKYKCYPYRENVYGLKDTSEHK